MVGIPAARPPNPAPTETPLPARSRFAKSGTERPCATYEPTMAPAEVPAMTSQALAFKPAAFSKAASTPISHAIPTPPPPPRMSPTLMSCPSWPSALEVSSGGAPLSAEKTSDCQIRRTSASAPAAVVGRGDTHPSPKLSREVRLAGEAAGYGDLAQRHPLLEQVLRVFDAPVEQVLVRRSPYGGAKHLGEVPSAVADLRGELVEAEIAMQVSVDEFEESFPRSNVQGRRTEGPRSRMRTGERHRPRQQRKAEAIRVEPSRRSAGLQFAVQQRQKREQVAIASRCDVVQRWPRTVGLIPESLEYPRGKCIDRDFAIRRESHGGSTSRREHRHRPAGVRERDGAAMRFGPHTAIARRPQENHQMPIERDIAALARRIAMPLEQHARLPGRAGGMEQLERAGGQGCQVRSGPHVPALHGEVI